MIFGQRRSHHRDTLRLNVPRKADYVLRLIFIALLVLLIKIWHLAVVERPDKEALALRPQKRKVLLKPNRGTIRDRFGIPLALNKVQYQVSIQYSEIREIPRVGWHLGANQERIKVYPRKEYIVGLSNLLGELLGKDPEDIEDEIYSKAALFSQMPYVLQKDLEEKVYFRLKMLEKDWVGLHAGCGVKRFYPQGKVAGDLVGHMGAISQKEYRSIVEEMHELHSFIKENRFEGGEAVKVAKDRLEELEELAYSRNDAVGKVGIEGVYEEMLRGGYGFELFKTDAQGRFLEKFPEERQANPGQGVQLAISAELQEFAENLLIQSEKIREGRSREFHPEKQRYTELKQPWIKGGAIIALDPHTGELLTMASYPRVDPNDFVASGVPKEQQKRFSRIRRSFELESHIGELWDQKQFLEREQEDGIEEELLTWESYLEFILYPGNPILSLLGRISVENGVNLQRDIEDLLSLSGQKSVLELINFIYPQNKYRSKLSDIEQGTIQLNLGATPIVTRRLTHSLNRFLSYLPENHDKLLLLDLCRICCSHTRFSDETLQVFGSLSLGEYHKVSRELQRISTRLRSILKNEYHTLAFKRWRKEYQKDFLKKMRKKEKEKGTYQHPYLEYLQKEERRQFQQFLKEYHEEFIVFFLKGELPFNAENENIYPYLPALVKEMEDSAKGKGELATAWLHLERFVNNYPLSAVQGLLASTRSFKGLTEKLWGSYPHIRRQDGEQLEKHLAAAFYPLHGFGYGRSQAYRQSTSQGSTFKIVTAYQALLETSRKRRDSSIFTSLNPLEMVDRVTRDPQTKKWRVGYTLSGKSIPQNYKGGRIPRSLNYNLGRLNLQKAIETSSNSYFALLTADVLGDPESLNHAASSFGFGEKTGIELPGEIAGNLPDDLLFNRSGLYSYSIGQHSLVVTPLQTAFMMAAFANKGKILQPHLVLDQGEELGASRWDIWMPPQIRNPILQALARTVYKQQTTSLWNISRYFRENPKMIQDFSNLKYQLLGKTSTAEAVEIVGIDREHSKNIYNHTWFAGIAFPENHPFSSTFEQFDQPELVVIVYLKYAGYGKETIPFVAQMIKKWREIKNR